MTLPCENVTNFNGTQSVYIFIEAEPFDKFLLFKILQFLLYILQIYFRLVIDFRIFCVILEKDQLQTCANAAITVFLISDLVLIIHNAIFPFIILIRETFWIHKIIGDVEAFLNTFIGIFNYLCLTVMTIEKFCYTNFPFRHLKYFSIRKTVVYMLSCAIPTTIFCICVHVKFHVHYISNTLSMFYCIQGVDFAGKHLFWVTPVLFIVFILYCHISIMVDLCHNQCHIPQLPGFTLDRLDIEFVGRFVRAATSVVILTTSVFVDLLLRVLFQYIDAPVYISRSIWVLSVLLRMINPLIILGGNAPLRNYVYNSGFHRNPSWLPMKHHAVRVGDVKQKYDHSQGNEETKAIKDINWYCKNVKCISKETTV